jgi:putative addiction module component (TIGR02574 family)
MEATMSDPVAELAKLGLALAPEDRERLAALLLASIDPEPASEVEATWDVEIRRRLAAYDRGESQAIEAETVFAKAGAIAR